MGRTYVIGDIHGCYYELLLLIEQIKPSSDDTLVFVGDYIDRGPHSREVIECILELSTRCNVKCLLGNHEAMFLDYLLDPDSPQAALYLYNGGGTTLASYADQRGFYEVPEQHISFVQNLFPFYEIPEAFIAHAGVPEIDLDYVDFELHKNDLLWSRRMRTTEFRWSKLVVHGHNQTDRVRIRPNCINVDTGCVYNKRLSAITLPEKRIVSVERLKREPPPFLRDSDGRRDALRFLGTVFVSVYYGGQIYELETINYSQTGMFLRYVGKKELTMLPEGIHVHGIVGADSLSAVEFRGTIVRRVSTQDGLFYGIRILPPKGVASDAWTSRGLDPVA